MTPRIIIGDHFIDERGKIQFVNTFDLSPVKRMYIIENAVGNEVRAWQGHKVEKKWFFAIKGKFEIFVVKIDDWNNPSKNLDVLNFELNSANEQILYVPGGYANGIKSLEEGSRLLIYSDQDLNSSKEDDYRFEKMKWVNWESKK